MRKVPVDIPPPDQLVRGRVYKLRCRNLSYGVWDGERGFIGIREKFGNRYLDHETHWNLNDVFGTVSGAEDTGVDVPDHIQIETSTGYVDQNGRPIVLDESLENAMGWKWKGWYRYVDTGEVCPKHDLNGFRYYIKHNDELFKFLDESFQNAG